MLATRARVLLICLVFGILGLIGCESNPSVFGPGLHQMVRVSEAQLQSGGLGADEGGPAVSQVLRPQAEVVRGDGTVVLGGRLAPGGVSLHVQAVGDPDHWVIGAKGFDFVVQDELQFSARLEFSHAITETEVRVRLQAAGANGRLGPVVETSFLMADSVPPARLLAGIANLAGLLPAGLCQRGPETPVPRVRSSNSEHMQCAHLDAPEALTSGEIDTSLHDLRCFGVLALGVKRVSLPAQCLRVDTVSGPSVAGLATLLGRRDGL